MVRLNVERSSSDYDIEIKHPEIVVVKNFINQSEQTAILDALSLLQESQ